MAFLVPDFGEIHAALEVGNIDLRPLVERLHEQEFQQDAFAAPRGAAQQDMGNVRKVDRHRPQQAFPQHQDKTFRGQVLIIPAQYLRQIHQGGDGVDQHPAFPLAIGHFHDGNIKGRLDCRPLVLPGGEGDTLILELPHCYPGIIPVPPLAEQGGGYPRMIDKSNAL